MRLEARSGSGSALTRARVVFAAAASFVFFQMVLQTFPSVMREGLVVDLSLNETGFGGLSSSFYYPYILLQVPAGIAVARFGARRVLICGALLCTVASFLFAMSQTAGYAETTRILMGLGAAPTVVCAMTLAAQWFPPRKFALLAALTEAAGMTGGAVGQEVLGYIVEHAGWRTAMFTCGVVSAFLLILIVLLVRNRTAGGDAGDDHWPGAAEIKRLLLSAPIIANTIAGGLVASAGVAFGMLWGVSYFQHFHGMSLTAASLCGSFYFWGCLPGMHLSGVAMGLTNMMIMGIGGLVFQQLIGVLAHSRGQGVPGAGALSVIIGAQVVALGILMVPRPKPAAG